MTQDRPIFIIGTERSGSNLLRLILNEHPAIALPHPPHILKELAPLSRLYGDLGDNLRFKRLIDDAVRMVELHFSPWDVAIDRDAVFREAAGRDLYCVKAAIYDQYRRAKGKPRWGCKSTFVVDYADLVLRRHPRSKFIHLVRDGRDVAVSARSSVFNHFHPHYVGRLWSRQQRKAIELSRELPPETMMSVRYEDLLRAPEKTVRGLCRFIEEDYSEAMLRFFEGRQARALARQSRSWENCAKPIMQENRAKYKQELDSEEVMAFELQAFEELRHYGYELENDHAALREASNRGLGLGRRLKYGLLENARKALETARSLVRDSNAGLKLRRRLFLLGLRIRLGRHDLLTKL